MPYIPAADTVNVAGQQERRLRLRVSVIMEPLPRLDRYKRRSIDQRLKAFWAVLKAHFAPQAEDDLARAEERHRGRNDLGES